MPLGGPHGHDIPKLVVMDKFFLSSKSRACLPRQAFASQEVRVWDFPPQGISRAGAGSGTRAWGQTYQNKTQTTELSPNGSLPCTTTSPRSLVLTLLSRCLRWNQQTHISTAGRSTPSQSKTPPRSRRHLPQGNDRRPLERNSSRRASFLTKLLGATKS